MRTEAGIVPLTPAQREEIMGANAAMASQALRVLAVAYRPLERVPEEPTPEDVERELVFVGLLGMIDPARQEVVPRCARHGVQGCARSWSPAITPRPQRPLGVRSASCGPKDG
jgi:Ca2+-transporting ATPase